MDSSRSKNTFFVRGRCLVIDIGADWSSFFRGSRVAAEWVGQDVRACAGLGRSLLLDAACVAQRQHSQELAYVFLHMEHSCMYFVCRYRPLSS